MLKSTLKKRPNPKTLKCKQYREMTFPKNCIILRKNQSFRHVYVLKSGQAAICSQNNSNPLHVYNQGDYLNAIQISMQVNCYKTIKALTKCEVMLIVLGKSQMQEDKKNVLIPKIEELRFYEIMIFKSLAYGLMLQLVTHFRKQVVSKFELTDFLKEKQHFTCFLVTGTLVLQSHKKKTADQGLRNVQSCHSQQRKTLLQNNNLRLLKFEGGELLFIDTGDKYFYVSEAQKCQIIYIPTQLLYYYLPPEFQQKVKELKKSQASNVKERRSSTFKALKSMTRSINKQNSKSCLIPQAFQNKIQRKTEKFQKARSIHYSKNNRQFRSYSQQKKKILQQRDKGYKQISELNRRKYGRNYIYQKRLQISRNIYGQNYTSHDNNQAYKMRDEDSIFFRRGVTVYETVTLKDDYGIIKQSSAMKFVRRNRLKGSQSKKSLNNSPVKRPRHQKEIETLTLNSVQKVRRDFESSSKTLLKNYKRSMVLEDY